jgi:hypothetical protein
VELPSRKGRFSMSVGDRRTQFRSGHIQFAIRCLFS